MKRLTLGKSKRLVSNEQFRRVLARRISARDGLLTLYMAPNDRGHPRLGVSISKSCGNSPVRNRLKRLIREVFRLSQPDIPPGFDYLLMVPPNWSKKISNISRDNSGRAEPTYDRFCASFNALVKAAYARFDCDSQH